MPRKRLVPIGNLQTYSRRFVTVMQLAEYTGIPKQTLYNHIQKGALRVRKIGGIVRIPIEFARDYCDEPRHAAG